MPKFTVQVKEVHCNIFEIEAPEGTSRKALEELANKALEEGDDCHFEYSHTLEPDEWVVRNEGGDFL